MDKNNTTLVAVVVALLALLLGVLLAPSLAVQAYLS